MHILRFMALGGALAAHTPCQNSTEARAPTPPKGDSLVTITSAEEGEQVIAMRSFARGIAIVPDTSHVWSLVRRRVPGPNGVENQLELWRSVDGGLSWNRALGTSTEQDNDGSIVMGSDGLLHVAWAAKTSQPGDVLDAMYQTIDPSTGEWLGQPQRLLEGTGSQDQFSVSDIESTPSGEIVVAVLSNRNPTDPAWTSGWSTGLLVRDVQNNWTGPFQVNVRSYGVWGDLQGFGDRVHVSYRTHINEQTIAWRTFDVTQQEFAQDVDTRVGPTKNAPRSDIANPCQTLVDLSGNVYVLHFLGQNGGTGGEWRMSFASGGGTNPTPEWTTSPCVADPLLLAGNENYTNITIARGPGNQVIVLHSPVAGDYSELKRRIYDSGQPVTDWQTIANGQPGDFFLLSGVRFTQGNSTLQACIGNRDSTEVQALASRWPVDTTWTSTMRRTR